MVGWWDEGSIRQQLTELDRFIWRRSDWKPVDVVMEESSKRICFKLSRAAETGFRLIPGGWARDFCVLCKWELNATNGPEHSIGYTNGRDWLCAECYEKFFKRESV